MLRAAFHQFARPDYPLAPFHPPELWPELAASRLLQATDPANQVYAAVRSLLATLGLDQARLGTAAWNPIGDLVQPGERVLIKPNLVLHTHPKGDDYVHWTVAHASTLRALVDYALLAVGSEGQVTIGDTPLENCLFDRLCQNAALNPLLDYYRSCRVNNVELVDFRTFETTAFPDGSVQRRSLTGDPRGYTDIDLGRQSLLQELEDRHGHQNYYTLADHTVDHLSTDTAPRGLPNRFHESGRHIYRIPNTLLDSDCVISVAKLKTHKFSGVTLALKNMIGITEGKAYLPHRRPGTPAQGGDSFPNPPAAHYMAKLRAHRALLRLLGGTNAARLRSLIRRFVPAPLPHQIKRETLWGDWHGNDTIWRSTLDLNQILFFGRRDGFAVNRSPRRYLSFIDGLIGMDHEAPMAGLPVEAKLLIAARDPVASDALAAWLMGFNPQRIPTIARAGALGKPGIGGLPLKPDDIAGNVPLAAAQIPFTPNRGWIDHLYRTASDLFGP